MLWAMLLSPGLTLTNEVNIGSSRCASFRDISLHKGFQLYQPQSIVIGFHSNAVPKESTQPILFQPGIAPQTVIFREGSQIRHP